MPTPILMPALSPTMTEGNLAKWVKNEGDEVKPGDVIAEIETDKATMEVEAVDEGTLGRILVAEGTADVPVNTPIATILAEGEEAGAAQEATPAKPQPKSEAAEKQRERPDAERKAAESAPPAAAEKPDAKGPAKAPSAAAQPPQPQALPDP